MRRKKLLILSSYGGYGHIAAENTLKRLLSDNYDIDVAYPIKELRIYNAPSGESFYNWLISNNLNWLTNWIVKHVSRKIFSSRTEKTTEIIQKHIEEKRSDLLISLIPFVNLPASIATRNCDIPFLLITTDHDITNWVFGIEKMETTEFKVTISSLFDKGKELLEQKGISDKAIEQIGFPLRPDFLSVESRKELRAKYEIPQAKNVVLIMMGGAGSKDAVKYVKALVARSMNLHLLVCAGRNQKLAKRLHHLRAATGNSVDVIPFTEKVHELLALSDLLITKPGPGTINEAYSLKLPILIDRTKPPLFWEEANIELVLRDGVGACIDHFRDLSDLVARFLFDEQTRELVIRSYESMSQNRFIEAIKSLIDEMVAAPASGEVLGQVARC